VRDRAFLSGILWRIAVMGTLLLLMAAIVYALVALLGVFANA